MYTTVYLIENSDIQNQIKLCNERTQLCSEVLHSWVCVCVFIFFYDLKSTLITLCASDVGAHSVAPFRGQLTGVGSLLPLCGS